MTLSDNAQPLWTLSEVREVLGDEIHGAPPAGFTGVSFDSREIHGGEIFVAIKGVRMDGHAFAARALRQGAGLSVVRAPDEEMKAAGPLLVVEDTLKALEALGRAARARTGAHVIGVTGSVGKTTTKEMLAAALSALGPTHAAKGSFNNHWGVPYTLANLPRGAAFGVFELGMNAPGEIAQLTDMVRPEVAIVTHVAESHIGAFDGLAGIARAKAEIFSGLAEGGAAIINADAPHADILRAAAEEAGAGRVFMVGAGEKADVRLRKFVVDAERGATVVDADIAGTPVSFLVGLPGEHMARNALIVLAVARALELDMVPLMQQLREMRPLPGRGRRHVLRLPAGGEILLIDESYNANPASVRAALEVLGAVRPGGRGRRVAILGDMLELGARGAALHAGLAEALEKARVDVLCTAGELMHHLWQAAPAEMRGPRADGWEELLDAVRPALRSGDVVLVKGSHGSRMHKLVEGLIEAFPPRED